MERDELVLAALAAARGAALTPVQVQKLFFLIDKQIPAFVGGPHFDFKPDDYGPFDSAVYSSLDRLRHQGLVEKQELSYAPRRQYRLTDTGQSNGDAQFSRLHRDAQDHLIKLVAWIRKQPFAELVSTIYKLYPDMKANSVFRD